MSDTGTGGQTASLTTSFSTVTTTLDPSSTSTSFSTITTSSVITTSIPPSTTTEIPTTSSLPDTTSTTQPTFTPPPETTPSPSVIIVTSTLPQPTPTFTPTTSSTSSSTSSTSTPSALSASGSGSGSSGLGTGGKIAIAVVIPVVVVAAAIIFGLWFWRKRKTRKSNEEQRKNEMAEYGFNPNSDPTLASAGVAGGALAGAAYAEDASDEQEDKSGYRGWGATSSNRKASTTLGSNGRPGGLASDNGSQPGGYYQQGSSPGTNPSDHYSGDPLMYGHQHGDGVGALAAGATGAATGAGLARHRSGNQGDIRRGPSNASSAYSNGPPHSEASSDVPGVPAQYYDQEVPYNVYNDAEPRHGPWGDGSYGGGQPVIRDVQARRNTRIERAPTMPQTQGGISQNF